MVATTSLLTLSVFGAVTTRYRQFPERVQLLPKKGLATITGAVKPVIDPTLANLLLLYPT